MAKMALGMSRAGLVRVLTASAALFGATGVLAPRVLEAAYAIPQSPHSRQLIRLFGSRMLAIAGWAFTARTPEETDRVLAAAVAVNVVDTLTALTVARDTGPSAVRAAATSAGFAALAAVVHSLED